MGGEGPSAYSGHLQVRPAGQGSEVEVHLHTTRVPKATARSKTG